MNTQKIAYYLLHKGTIGFLLLSCSILIATIGMAQKKSKQPLVVFVTGDHEYSSEATMPKIAAELEKNYGFRTKVLKAYPDMVEMFDRDIAKFKELEKKLERARLEVLE